MKASAGFNVYGYLTSSVGLGVSARHTITMLRGNRREVRAIDLDPGGGLLGTDPTLKDLIARSADVERQAINIFHINPDGLRHLLTAHGFDLGLDECLNVCVPFWEASHLPRNWLHPLAVMDVILAPTQFVREAIVSDLPDATVFDFPQAVYLPEGVVPDRQRWRIPTDDVAFVTSFAVASNIERKNPWATVDAFNRAFPTGNGATLVVKVNGNPRSSNASAELGSLRALCAKNRNIRLIEEPLSYVEVLSLYDSCDVLVSLHRSEGLGLSLLEAMSLGKPVIGTGWSGNMDFMTSGDSVPIPFAMVDAKVPWHSPYHRRRVGTLIQWADPDVGAAAEWMIRLGEDAELRHQIGVRAKQKADQVLKSFEAGAVLRDLDTALADLRGAGRRDSRVGALRYLRWTHNLGYPVRLVKAAGKRVVKPLL